MITCKPIPILTYHSISKAPKGTALRSLAVTPRKLHWQFILLKLFGYRAVSMSELLPYLEGKKIGKVVGLTFDDGYLDNVQNALPLLKKFGFSATCYILPDCIGQYNRWDFSKKVVQRKLMEQQDVAQWLAAGNEIGSHGLTHLDLTVADPETLQAEVAHSKQKLEQLFQCTIEHFAYPYGKYNQEVVAQVAKSHYKTAVTTDRGRVRTGDELLTLPRVNIPRSVLTFTFLAKVFGRYECKRRKA